MGGYMGGDQIGNWNHIVVKEKHELSHGVLHSAVASRCRTTVRLLKHLQSEWQRPASSGFGRSIGGTVIDDHGFKTCRRVRLVSKCLEEPIKARAPIKRWRNDTDERLHHSLEPPYDAGRHARDDCPGGNVVRDDRAGGDYGVMTNGHSLQHHRPIAQPDPVFNDNRYTSGVPCLVFDAVEITVHNHDVDADEAIVANFDVRTGSQRAAVVDKDVIANLDMAARQTDDFKLRNGRV